MKMKTTYKERVVSATPETKLAYFNSLVEALDFKAGEPIIVNKSTEKEFLVILPCGCVEIQYAQGKDTGPVSSEHKFCIKHQADYE